MTHLTRSIRIALLVLTVSTIFAASSSASTVTLFNNIGAPPFGGFAIYGTDTIGGFSPAVGFTPSSTADFASVTIVADYYGGSSSFLLSLDADASGLPGSPIETIAFNLPAHVDNVYPSVTILSVLNPTLTVGTLYWISVSADPANTGGKGEWWFYQNALGQGAEKSGSNAWIGSDQAPGVNVQGLASDDVAAVPEPGTVFLLGSGLALALYRMRTSNS